MTSQSYLVERNFKKAFDLYMEGNRNVEDTDLLSPFQVISFSPLIPSLLLVSFIMTNFLLSLYRCFHYRPP